MRSLAPSEFGDVRPVLGMLALAARLLEIACCLAGGGVLPGSRSPNEVVAASAETVKIGVRGAELGRDVGRGVALERVEVGEQPGAASVAIFGQSADGGVDADPGGGAGDPVLVAFVGPVVGEVVDGLVEGVGDGVDGGLVAGAGQGDVGEFAAAALGEEWVRSHVAPCSRCTVRA